MACTAAASARIGGFERRLVSSRASPAPGRSARPSTRLASTAPASTETSWSGSPTKTRRVSARTDSISRAIIVSETIDDSSTTITSWGKRLPRWCRKRVRVSGRLPSSRCRVCPESVPSRAWSSAGSFAVSSRTASSSLAAALPVGAASAIRSGVDDCSARRASSPATAVVLPVPGPPVSDRRPVRERDPDRCPLLVVAGQREDPLQTRVEYGGVQGRRGECSPGEHVVDHLPLLAPVAVEVEQVALQVQHRRRDERTLGQGRAPPVRVGPRQVGGKVGHGRQVDAHRAAAHRAHGERHSEQQLVVGHAEHGADPVRDMEVTCGEHAGLVEGAQQARRCVRDPPVVGAVDLEELDHADTSSGLRSSRSDSEVTRSGGRGQLKTPAGCPSTTGVSGPHMPRT